MTLLHCLILAHCKFEFDTLPYTVPTYHLDMFYGEYFMANATTKETEWPQNCKILNIRGNSSTIISHPCTTNASNRFASRRRSFVAPAVVQLKTLFLSFSGFQLQTRCVARSSAILSIYTTSNPGLRSSMASGAP